MAEIQDFGLDDNEKTKRINVTTDKKVAVGLGCALVVLITAGSVFWAKNSAENERKSKDIALENLLRGRGFNDAGIGIDVSGGGKKLRVSCNPPDPVTSEIVDGSAITFFVNQNGDATLPLTDAEGQDLGTDNMQVFPLGTKEAINEFVAGFIVDTCAVINQN